MIHRGAALCQDQGVIYINLQAASILCPQTAIAQVVWRADRGSLLAGETFVHGIFC